MAGETKKATHSLSTEIQMLLETQGLDKVVGDVDEVSERIQALTKPVRQFKQAFEELNYDSPIKDLVKVLNNFTLDSVSVDAQNLTKVLENKIANAIAKSKIEFIGDRGNEKYPFKVKMGADFWEKNQKNVAKAMAESFSNFELDTKDIPPLDTREILKEFQAKFNKQIVELIKDEDVFSLYTIDPNEKRKKYRYKRQFRLSEDAVSEIIGAIESKFIQHLSDPNNIEIGEVPKLKIKSVELKQAMLNIQESIGNLDDLLGVDPDILDELPNIQDRLVVFKDRLSEMVGDINRLALQLESITFGKVSEDDVKNAIKIIEGLKESVIVKIDSWVADLVREIESGLKIEPDLKGLNDVLDQINMYVSNILKNTLDDIKIEIKGLLQNKQIDIDRTSVKHIDLTQVILDTIMEQLFDEDIFNVNLDGGLIKQVLDEWFDMLENVLSDKINNLTSDTISNIENIIKNTNAQFKLMLDEIELEIMQLFREQESAEFYRKELSGLKKLLKSEVVRYFTGLLQKADITYPDNVNIKVPKTFATSVKKMIDQIVLNYVEHIKAGYKETDIQDVGSIVEKLSKRSTMLVNSVLRKTNKILSDISIQYNNSSEEAVSTKNLLEVFRAKSKGIVEAFVASLENVIGLVNIIENSLEEFQQSLIKQINVDLSTSEDVDFSSIATILDKTIEKIKVKLEQFIKLSIDNWIPNVDQVSLDIGAYEISNIFKKHIDDIVEDYVEKLCGELSKLVSVDNMEITAISNKIKFFLKQLTEEISRSFIGKLREVKVEYNKLCQTAVDLFSHKLATIVMDFVNSSFDNLDSKDLYIARFDFSRVVNKAHEVLEKILLRNLTEESLRIQEKSDKLFSHKRTVPSLRTTALRDNINSLTQKLINERAKQVTAMSKQLVKSFEIEDGMFNSLKDSTDNALEALLVGYQEASERFADNVFTEKEVKNIYGKLLNNFTESFSVYVDIISEGLQEVAAGEYEVETRKLHPKLKKTIADYLGVKVQEFVKEFPKFTGKEAQDILLQGNVRIILQAVNDVVTTGIKDIVTSYQDSIKNIEIEPDVSLVDYIYDQIIKLQDTIITRTKKMVREQFKFLTEEVKAMNVDAKSLGYKPTLAFSREVMKANPALAKEVSEASSIENLVKVLTDATRKGSIKIEEVSAQGVDVSSDNVDVDGEHTELNADKLIADAGTVVVDGGAVDFNTENFPTESIRMPIVNLMKGMPFDKEKSSMLIPQLLDLSPEDFIKDNIFKNKYDPLDIEKILFKTKAQKDSKLAQVASNMAKYFLAGYLMRLPIKALTEANKIATELDYHITKARQNILIKDPSMRNTARRKVYDEYKSTGRDIRSPEFNLDVDREASVLRRLMKYDMPDYLLNISKAYQQEISDVGRFYSIASRRSKDPYEALTKTREIAKIAAAEEDLDTDFAATGLEAVSAQWGISAGELNRYTNMILKTAMLSNTTVTDLLMAQRDTAAMFKSRLSGMDEERAFATSMALSSMFVESTGKSGREAGTFWRNVLQRPYVKDSRKFLEEISQYDEFKNLTPFTIDAEGRRVQKDFLTMFADILEATLKVDDPSKMTILSEIFPIRTIGGAESAAAFITNLRKDLQKSIEALQDIGELDLDATVDTVSIKEVIEKYIENILDVSDEDIAKYIAGLQDSTRFNAMGLQAQWQSTIYNVFRELKEESSAAMTYLTAILRKFEENADKLSDVIKIFAKIGIGYLGKSMLQRFIEKVESMPVKPNKFQKVLAGKYNELQIKERAAFIKKSAIEEILVPYKEKKQSLETEMDGLYEQRQQLHKYIIDNADKEKNLEETLNYRNALMKRDLYDDQLVRLRASYDHIDNTIKAYSQVLNNINKSYDNIVSLGDFLYSSMGARDVGELKERFADYIRNEVLYRDIARAAIRSQLDHGDNWYEQLTQRKVELEDKLIEQQKTMFMHYKNHYSKDVTGGELKGYLDDIPGDSFYRLGNRISKKSLEVLADITKAIRKFNSEGDLDFDAEFEKMRKSFNKYYDELEDINTELLDLNAKRLETERIIFEAERPKLTFIRNRPVLEEKTSEEVIDYYRKLLPVAGIDVENFESGLDALTFLFREGKYDVDKYEDSLRKVARKIGIADRDFLTFKETVRKLNKEIIQGKQAIIDYVTALSKAGSKSRFIRPGKGIYTSTKDSEEIASEENDAVATGSTGDKIKGMIMGSGVLATVGKGIKGFLGGKLKTMGGGLLTLGRRALSSTLNLGVLYAVTDLVGSVFSGFTERSMTEAERLSIEADKLESFINTMSSFKIDKSDSGIKRLLKGVAGYGYGGYTSIKHWINRFFGGVSPTFKDSWATVNRVLKSSDISKDDLRAELKEMFEVESKRNISKTMRQEELLNKNPFLDKKGRLRDKNDPFLINLPLEDLMDFIDKRMNTLNQILTESDALFTKEKVNLLVNGFAENSKEVRKAVEKHLDRNINALKEVVESFKLHLTQLQPGTSNYNAMRMRILDLESKISEHQLQLYQTQFSEFDEIMDKYSRESSKIQTKYDIKKYDAIISGIKEDSGVIRKLETISGKEQARIITMIQSSLRRLKDKFHGKPEQAEKILSQIWQLEADKKRILADISEKMSKGLSTFNLPSGIKPITYYEAITKRNTHRNVTIASGDTVVNVNIDNMTGTDKAIDEIGKRVSKAVTEAQKGLVRQFANDVKTGMGNNYYSWNNY